MIVGLSSSVIGHLALTQVAQIQFTTWVLWSISNEIWNQVLNSAKHGWNLKLRHAGI